MIYLIITASLFILLLVYFKIADHFNIIDKPNHRSSHNDVTIRGGGIVYPFAILLYTAFFHEVSSALVGGIIIISLISFWDDVKNLPNKVRLLVHLLSVTALLLSVNAFQEWPVWLLSVVYVLVIGTINAYNFMDGINGITGLYSLITLCSLLYVNYFITPFTDSAFIICPLIASIVFLFFNFRKKAKCFAGDVGSISVGFLIIALLILVIMKTGDMKYILFLTVYGVDSVLTIIHRLIMKQNIFQAHRLHFYQILANENKINHLLIASIYGFVQLVINSTLILSNLNIIIYFAIAVMPLILVYIITKPIFMKLV